MTVVLLSSVLGSGCRPQTPRSHRIPVKMAIGSQTEMVYLASMLAGQLGYHGRVGLDVAISDETGALSGNAPTFPTDVFSGRDDDTRSRSKSASDFVGKGTYHNNDLSAIYTNEFLQR